LGVGVWEEEEEAVEGAVARGGCEGWGERGERLLNEEEGETSVLGEGAKGLTGIV
jgi:hypothetical protein